MEELKLGQKVSFGKVLKKQYTSNGSDCNSKGMKRYLKGLKSDNRREKHLLIWKKVDVGMTTGVVAGVRQKREGVIQLNYDYESRSFICVGTIKTVLVAFALNKHLAIVKYEDVITE